MESIINKKSPNNRKILLNNISSKNKGARDGVDRDSNLSESFENFNIINYLTNSDQKENLIPIDTDNLNVIKKSFDNSTTNRNTKTDTNDKVLERKSSFDFLEWLCTPDNSTNMKEREKREQQNETNFMNMSFDSFMECIMNPVIQSQHNLSCSDFDDVMNSFLSARTNSPTSSEVERSKSPALLAKSIIRKRNSNAILLKSSVQENSQNRQRKSPNLLQSIMGNSSSSNGVQENSQNRQNFDVLFVRKREPDRESSICTKRKIAEESWNLPKRQCRSRVILYRDISVKNILIPDFDIDTASKFNNNWISYIGSSQWLETRSRETITNRKSIKINIFIDNFESKSQEQPLKVKCLRNGKLKVYKLQCLLIAKQSNQNYDVDTLFKILSQNENAKIQPETVQDLSTSVNLNDSQVSQESAESNLSMSQRTLRKGLNEICENQNIGNNQNDDYNSIGKLVVLSRIQQIFIKIFGAFQDQKIPCLSVRHRDYKNSVFKDDMLQLKPINEASMRIIKYNAKPSHSKFCLILYLLAKIYQLVEHNTKLTKREIFYQIKHLIKNQTQISNAVDEISCLLNIGIWKLNIVSQKGLVYGDLRLVFSSGETLNCNVPGTLIPFNVDEIVEIRSRAYFILVVEKESIFHKLIEEDLPNKMTRPFLMITGKGYPNLYTQLFLKKLWRIMSIPVFILVDPDPFGIHIMLNYRFGSMNHSHLSKDLALPRARWLGVFPSEIVKFGIKTTPITRKDRKMIQNLIASPYMNTHQQIKTELELLLEKNLKASIEGLIKTNKFLSSSYLPTKFVNRDFI